MNSSEYVNIYVTIGNSDNKLGQLDWSNFCRDVDNLVRAFAHDVHGEFYSLPNAEWQNACWSFTIHASATTAARANLGIIAHEFEQDSIAWAEAQVVFLGAL